MIREVPSGERIVRWAKIFSEYDGVSRVRTQDRGLYVELVHLRRSTKDEAFVPLSLMERVWVASGTRHRGEMGRITNFPDDLNDTSLFTVSVYNKKEFKIQMRYIARYFVRGDKVEVVRGEHAGRQGFVTGISLGGSVEIFDVRTIFQPSIWVLT
jgi:hypothetical protein